MRVLVGLLLVLSGLPRSVGPSRQRDGPLVGEQRRDAGHARDHRDGGEAGDHQAEPLRRALLLLQPQLLGLGQLPGLFQLPLPGRFPGLPFGLRLGVAGFQKTDRRLEIAAVLLGPFGIGRFLLAPD